MSLILLLSLGCGSAIITQRVARNGLGFLPDFSTWALIHSAKLVAEPQHSVLNSEYVRIEMEREGQVCLSPRYFTVVR